MDPLSLEEHYSNIGEQFINIYYGLVDKARMLITNICSEDAVFIWNTTIYNGAENIQAFWMNAPASKHIIFHEEVKVVPIIDTPQPDVLRLIIITALGVVKYDGYSYKLFKETFKMVVYANGSWRLVHNTYEVVNLPSFED